MNRTKNSKYVWVWVGGLRSPQELTNQLEDLYKCIGLSDDEPDPEVVLESELVEVQELIEPLSFSAEFLDDAVSFAKKLGFEFATTAVAVYSSHEKPCEGATLPPSALSFLGTFCLSLIDQQAEDFAGTRDAVKVSLHASVESEDWENVKCLIRKGESINQLDEQGESPLYRACRLGKIERVKTLLQLRADTEVSNEIGHTPLMVAAATENENIIEELLDAGASVSTAATNNGYTPIHWSVLHTPLDSAKVQRIIELLLKAGSEINSRANDGSTPLMHAAWFGSKPIVSFLIASGADASVQDNRGRTAMSLAVERNHHTVSELLRNAPKQSARYKHDSFGDGVGPAQSHV